MNVARNSARVDWTNTSLEKVRSRRGENWLLASCSVTTVKEKVNDVTVISELDTASNTVRAAPGSPPKVIERTQDGTESSTRASSRGINTPATRATSTPTTGSGHSWDLTVSRAAA